MYKYFISKWNSILHYSITSCKTEQRGKLDTYIHTHTHREKQSISQSNKENYCINKQILF